MGNPSIHIPNRMLDEVDGQRPDTASRSQYVREALTVRMMLEAADEWDDALDRANAITNG